MSEKTPLLHYRLTANTGQVPQDAPLQPREHRGRADEDKLGVVVGVVIPTLLSMFSVVVFLRIGKWKSHTKKKKKHKYSLVTSLI